MNKDHKTIQVLNFSTALNSKFSPYRTHMTVIPPIQSLGFDKSDMSCFSCKIEVTDFYKYHIFKVIAKKHLSFSGTRFDKFIR